MKPACNGEIHWSGIAQENCWRGESVRLGCVGVRWGGGWVLRRNSRGNEFERSGASPEQNAAESATTPRAESEKSANQFGRYFLRRLCNRIPW
ncbi:MAG: hypothetical protein A2428_16250 [Bdellovibrionales bacterium RIFOXYC1_FULL_54_43]|nr:MAG: hypothetical protein A2428_16250 [Bdellovibrionales bacterium RIFOXYC1_FULL_54_43]